MLADPRGGRFANHFKDRRLKLNQIDFTTPDPKHFKDFDVVLSGRSNPRP